MSFYRLKIVLKNEKRDIILNHKKVPAQP